MFLECLSGGGWYPWQCTRATVGGNHDVVGMVFSGLFSYCAKLSLATGCLRGASRLHCRLLHSVVHLPASFYDTTPVGRILNRFSRDIDTLDLRLEGNVGSLVMCMWDVVGTMAIISYSTPAFLGVAAPLVLLYAVLQVVWSTLTGLVCTPPPLP